MPNSPGPGTDAQGRPVLDPTENVLDLVQAAVKRLDDLRQADARHADAMAQVRAEHARELRMIETDRLNAIRAVDVGAVQRAAEVQATQAGALAAQVLATADAFRVSLAAALEPIQKDIRDLRDAQSRTVGGKDQGTDTRTNMSALVAALGVALILVFGVLTVLAR